MHYFGLNKMSYLNSAKVGRMQNVKIKIRFIGRSDCFCDSGYRIGGFFEIRLFKGFFHFMFSLFETLDFNIVPSV